MNKNNISLTGKSVIVKNVSTDKLEEYLNVRRYATMFRVAYDMDAGLWKNMKQQLVDDITGKNVICLIYEAKSMDVCGYIELEMGNRHKPKVGIGILEDYRERGYALEASALLLYEALEEDDIECIEWLAIANNEASNKIAKRLGGEIVRKDPLIPREIMEGWGNDDAINEGEIPCCNVYEICSREGFAVEQ